MASWMERLSDQELRRREELQLLRQQGIEPYPYSYERTATIAQLRQGVLSQPLEAFADVALAGRIMVLRRMGKVTFADVQDESGRLQVYFRADDLGEHYKLLPLLDIGDIIGARGFLFYTRTGELTLHVRSFQLLCKALRPIPVPKEVVDQQGHRIRYDAFTDKEQRYRYRYLDLLVNPEVREVFRKRAHIIRAIRDFFDARGWLEVETPVLQPVYGGANARPFRTYFNALDSYFYLRIATELYLKRLIVGGFEGVYEIGKNFRNEGIDRLHNPEFTALELYVAYRDYEWMMELVEELLETVVQQVNGSLWLQRGGQRVELRRPFRRVRWYDAVHEATGYDLRECSVETLREIAERLGIQVSPTVSEPKLLDEIFSTAVQPRLVEPTFVIDYPLSLSPLAKRHRSLPGVAERFELFLFGMEIANAFSELNDPMEQRQRLEQQARWREKGDLEAMPLDEDFLRALEVGMPPTAGLGIGIDRLVMILTEQPTIRDVILFPHMRPAEPQNVEQVLATPET
ncbi:MAG: lysine--tRNA ligase [Candidatus Kapabacteria bacterium]|nr:lysine--tRNA ligase [Candidatus Kapabacteria bacterium]MDW8011692.1 lysine--tRNA ligase [Bacteroidota bacterium]